MTSLLLPILLSVTLQGDVVAFNDFNFNFQFGQSARASVALPTAYDYYNLSGADDHYTVANGDKYQVATY